MRRARSTAQELLREVTTPATSPVAECRDRAKSLPRLDAGDVAELELRHASADVTRTARELLEAVLEGVDGRELEALCRAFRRACAEVPS